MVRRCRRSSPTSCSTHRTCAAAPSRSGKTRIEWPRRTRRLLTIDGRELVLGAWSVVLGPFLVLGRPWSLVVLGPWLSLGPGARDSDGGRRTTRNGGRTTDEGRRTDKGRRTDEGQRPKAQGPTPKL